MAWRTQLDPAMIFKKKVMASVISLYRRNDYKNIFITKTVNPKYLYIYILSFVLCYF